ncbi:MAG: hypothetical protein FIA91_07065 [Geobacter sp.]|nr:hypothetical protein [Geobacter sp.]
MALVNEAKREINAKIVYIGPKGAGKATAIRSIYSRLRPELRSELKTMVSGGNQMLFFDYSYPSTQNNGDYTIRFHLYSIISDGTAPAPWKMLLKGVDGVVFMADSTDGRMFANLESCAQLYDAFAHYGIKAGDIPLKLQCNKRDLPGAIALAALKEELFPELQEEPLGVCALSGEGLLEGLSAVSAAVMRRLGVEAAVDATPCNAVAPAAEAALVEENDQDVQCDKEKSCFRVELSGKPQAGDDGEVVIPLRLAGGACGKEVDFKIKVSVTV